MNEFWDWVARHGWVAWLAASAVLACAEMLTLDFTLLMLASGALAGAITAAILPGAWIAQVLVAVAVGGIMLAVLRPTLLKKVRDAPGYRSSLDTLLGAEGTATHQITEGAGEVKVHGELWEARPMAPGVTIEAGESIEVFQIDGTTLIVYPSSQGLGWSGGAGA
ncbi:MAG: NfeD family protein [Acidipropionibacterium acidipropionici]|jgi:membrane protein implicated in regulation of membrane protease activity|uniref:Nodulation efficiency protein D n=2 Tax=Acidipropionibacterium acidipropionici TaxID=1748 RepID=A0AAC8YDR3_9ACTN|nr:NfeD family protein [Acidipropionibacterium acidipropionici]AFV90009.1 Nodulation efficiency protein D [Acidipropionibacterium acidipropionici ATCC 4875]AMS04846.1 nodulation efficiency protein D [Acidipropionibacterium acidipropionici]AOZ46330.1 nodulation efficiency protein D [Acidipropionibacterium acidipropionici]AZP37631.1 NfeD family protein [Acidipropionibacterium acidipropionici]